MGRRLDSKKDRPVRTLPPPFNLVRGRRLSCACIRGWQRFKFDQIESLKRINERVQELAEKKGCTMAQVALAWSMANDFVSAPIVGTTSIANLKELIGELAAYFFSSMESKSEELVIAGVHISLTKEEKKYLDEPYTPQALVSLVTCQRL